MLAVIPRMITTTIAHGYTTTVEEAGHTPIGIVLAAETINGKPSAVLRDRLDRGVELYQAGVVESAGDVRTQPRSRRSCATYAVEHGVPEEDILLDDGGIRTYATCYNAHTQLGLDEAIFVTQPVSPAADAVPVPLIGDRSHRRGCPSWHVLVWFQRSPGISGRRWRPCWPLLRSISPRQTPANTPDLYQEGTQP